MNYKTLLVDPPEDEPIDLPEARLHLKISSTLEDSLITTWIISARRLIERYLNRALITQQYELYLDNWPNWPNYAGGFVPGVGNNDNVIMIPYPPLQSVDELSYFDGNGVEQVLDPSTYYWVSVADEPARITKKYNAVWPLVQLGRPDAIKLTFTAGYGDDSTDVPEDIRSAMKIWLTDLFENRGSTTVGPAILVNKIPNYIIDLIHSYKIYDF